MITVYTTPSCPWCGKTKEFLTSQKVRFREVDVSESPEAAEELFNKSGQMSVPVIDIDGTVILGFDTNALQQALKM